MFNVLCLNSTHISLDTNTGSQHGVESPVTRVAHDRYIVAVVDFS